MLRITVQQTHTRLLRTVTSQPSVSKLFQESSTSENVIKAEVMVTFLCSITYPLQQLIILAPYSKPFSWIAKLPRDTRAGEQRQLSSSTRLWGRRHTVITILSSIVKLTLSVWASTCRVILTWTKWAQWIWEFLMSAGQKLLHPTSTTCDKW